MNRPVRSFRTLPLVAVILALSNWLPRVSGQTFISAMAGYIHHVEGEVFLEGRAIHPTPSDFLHVFDGQRLRTAEGRAELMLIPGSFLRLGDNSEIEMISSGLTNVRFRVTAGSAVVDLIAVFEKDSIGVLAGDREVRFPKPGLYRLNAGDAAPTVSVFRGKAVVVSADGKREVKGKQRLDLSEAGDAAIEKFDPAPKDALDEWNKTRSTALAQAARKSNKEGDDGMDPLYRAWLEMTMRRPSQAPVSNQPDNRAPRGDTTPRQKR